MTRLENLIGFVHPKYEKVEKVFRKNFHDGWEREGAAIAVYHKGELIVDLQGGYADKSSGTEMDTRNENCSVQRYKGRWSALRSNACRSRAHFVRGQDEQILAGVRSARQGEHHYRLAHEP
ncbi:hypothetical protein COOONC_14889 [Cooperia oncophora]